MESRCLCHVMSGGKRATSTWIPRIWIHAFSVFGLRFIDPIAEELSCCICQLYHAHALDSEWEANMWFYERLSSGVMQGVLELFMGSQRMIEDGEICVVLSSGVM